MDREGEGRKTEVYRTVVVWITESTLSNYLLVFPLRFYIKGIKTVVSWMVQAIQLRCMHLLNTCYTPIIFKNYTMGLFSCQQKCTISFLLLTPHLKWPSPTKITPQSIWCFWNWRQISTAYAPARLLFYLIHYLPWTVAVPAPPPTTGPLLLLWLASPPWSSFTSTHSWDRGGVGRSYLLHTPWVPELQNHQLPGNLHVDIQGLHKLSRS